MFIAFEGIDYSGKSTQAMNIENYLRKRHRRSVIRMREPGGTKIGEKIRDILLNYRHKAMTPETELFLYMASRAQLVRERMVPLLKKGEIIILDRYLFSSAAYQGTAGGLGINTVLEIGALAIDGLIPDLTFIMDIEPAKAWARRDRSPDRVERKGIEYQRRVREGFRTLYSRFKRRGVHLIDADRDPEVIHREICTRVDKKL